MGEMSLGMLRMVMSTMTDGTARGTNTQTTDVELSSGTVTVLGSLVDELIGGGGGFFQAEEVRE